MMHRSSPQSSTFACATRYILLQSDACHRFATYDGIDACGSRLADEVRGLVAETPSLRRISIVAHSMGGLMARCVKDRDGEGREGASGGGTLCKAEKLTGVCKAEKAQVYVACRAAMCRSLPLVQLNAASWRTLPCMQVCDRAAVQPSVIYYCWPGAWALCHIGHSALRL